MWYLSRRVQRRPDDIQVPRFCRGMFLPFKSARDFNEDKGLLEDFSGLRKVLLEKYEISRKRFLAFSYTNSLCVKTLLRFGSHDLV